jgi:rSAM/selenodomain-associated transferase 2
VISIIVPIYNEEKILSKNSSQFKNLSQYAELIFIDGGSSDKSIEIASDYGKVLCSKKGRAVQMNCGAYSAKEKVLLFLHADTFIYSDALASIKRAIKDNGFIGGCLTQRIDKDGAIYRLIENFGNIRAKITKVFYGDQGIFVRKDIFLKIGGCPRVSIMEDVLFSKRLRKAGKTIVLKDNIFVSPRRWQNKGIIKTIFLYSSFNILFWLGTPLEKIKPLYDDLR